MNAIKLLKQDHRAVEALFAKYAAAGSGAIKEKQKLAAQISKELAIHASIEEQFFYPAARKLSEKTKDLVLESLEEHHIAKWTLVELEKMTPSDERFDAKMTVLMENIRHHIKEEEHELFPQLEKLMSSEVLEALGRAMHAAKEFEPTHPHPMAPDSPPGNLVSAALAMILDTGKDLVEETAHAASDAVTGRLAALKKRAAKARKVISPSARKELR